MAPLLTIPELCSALGDTVERVIGDATVCIRGVKPLSDIEPDCLTFATSAGETLAAVVKQLPRVVLMCRADPVLDTISGVSATLVCVPNPRLAFTRVLRWHYAPPPPAPGVHRLAFVHADAKVDPTASIGAFCHVAEQVEIGPGTVLFPHVCVYRDCRIGARVVLHSGTVIGADGFGFERNASGVLEKFPQIGGVVIEDEVEMGANCTVDRGAIGDTVVGRGTKFDDQIHVGHNARVGRNVLIAAQAMLSGSVTIGDNCWISPSSAVINKVAIGTGVTVGLGAVVIKDVPDGQTVMGSPAVSSDEFRALRSALRGLVT